MASALHYTVPLKRKASGRTNYKRRLKLLVSRQPRLVIRKTLRGVILQIVRYDADGDKVLVSVNSQALSEYGLSVQNGNVPVAYLTGLLLAKEAKAHKLTDVVVDIGLQKLTPQSRIYAAVKGVLEGGIKMNAGQEVLPSDDRVNGKIIEAYAKTLKADDAAYKRQFSAYLKASVDPTAVSAYYAKIKQAILAK